MQSLKTFYCGIKTALQFIQVWFLEKIQYRNDLHEIAGCSFVKNDAVSFLQLRDVP